MKGVGAREPETNQAVAVDLASDCSALSCLLAPQQHTLASEFTRSGVGLHSGITTQVKVLPAPANSGRYFVRIDLPDQPQVAAQIGQVHQTILSTELINGAATVRTVEHLLAALSGMGIDNARIEIDGLEVPLLDGSALGWVEAIGQVGIASQSAMRPRWQLTQPVWIQEGDAFVAALPAAELRFTYGIDFSLPAIGNQWYSWSPSQEISQEISQESFATAVAPARTFGLAHQIEQLQQRGLIKGGSLDNALVCSESGWINPPLRFSNEPARHKLLDLVGDLSLLGYFPQAHFLAYKASHHLHTRLAHQLTQFLTG
ncbi:MAG: UDP-3-O-acyl-N-acetylglucosamine deacetylase [Leptolyngbya sp. IPPAS B-1204]|nr:UDP-3-O-acyl-N-acetylglucosamine deacetylase [Elainella sp. C42_A2020_010]RNJ70374.1 MAG: UDP-3-O-acyl-N-acetylglucosamine deacetylase [Leptolyngbya sp. IPPAS B-1204]